MLTKRLRSSPTCEEIDEFLDLLDWDKVRTILQEADVSCIPYYIEKVIHYRKPFACTCFSLCPIDFLEFILSFAVKHGCGDLLFSTIPELNVYRPDRIQVFLKYGKESRTCRDQIRKLMHRISNHHPICSDILYHENLRQSFLHVCKVTPLADFPKQTRCKATESYLNMVQVFCTLVHGVHQKKVPLPLDLVRELRTFLYSDTNLNKCLKPSGTETI